MKITGITCMRNEGAFLIEWLAYHRAIGITDVLVYSNDCDDGTDAMLDRLADLGWVAHLRNPGPWPEGPQWAALKAAERHPLVRRADWLLVFDIDEFVNIRIGDGTLAALMAACPQATGFVLTWRMFGNAGLDSIGDTPVTRAFTRAAPEVLHWPWRAQMVKTLFRNDGSFRKLGVHRPRSHDRAHPFRWVDGTGHALPASFANGRLFTDPGAAPYRLAQVNHYALGSMQDFLVKADRGRANRDLPTGLGYWVDRNFSDVEDRSIHRMEPAWLPLRETLLADPVLGPLHRAAVAWRQARFRTLMREEHWRALYGGLRMTPPSRSLTRDDAEHIRKYGLAGKDEHTVS